MRLLLATLVFSVSAAAQPTADVSSRYVRDFGVFWQTVAETYAYFDQRQTNWDRVGEMYGFEAAAAVDDRAFLSVLERAVGELYDDHAGFGVNNSRSPRLVPSGTDLWAEWVGGRAVMTQVRRGSEGEAAGLRAGMEVVTVGGHPVREAARAWLPKTLRADDPEAWDWALRTVLAGTHQGPVRLAASRDGVTSAFAFTPGLARPDERLTVETLADNVGYLRPNDALGDNRLIADIDAALETLRETRGLILDLRDTPGGGNTTVANALMSRLLAEPQPYQRHEDISAARTFGVRRVWVESVMPRGPFTYGAPVVVLVGRWTGSMGEGLAIGLDGMGRATIVGSRMAGLLGAIGSYDLPETGISLRLPTERLTHLDGTPREAFVPTVLVESGAPESDTVLARGLAVLAEPR